MHSYFFGISSYDAQSTQSTLDSVLADANNILFCGGAHIAVKGEGCCKSDTSGCHIHGLLSNKEDLQKELGIDRPAITDAELITLLFQKFGPKAFEKMQGNVVILYLDKKEEKTYIFRPQDALSSVYFSEGENFLFASELKLLLRCDRIAKRLDKAGISAYLQLGFIPAPMTPIQNVTTLLPGFLLTYANKKIILKKIQSKPPQQLEGAPSHEDPNIFFDLTHIIDQIFHLDFPQSALFFPAIFSASASENIAATATQVVRDKTEFKPKAFSYFLKHLKPIFSKIYFSTHRKIPSYLQFKKNQVIFKPHELHNAFGSIAHAFDDYPFFAKKYFEDGIETMSNILFQQDALFFPYIKHFKAWKDSQSFKAGLIERFPSYPFIEKFITDEVKTFLVEALQNGSLVDLDLLNARAVTQMNRIQLWTIFVLEIWIRLCIDSNPNQETLDKVHEAFNLKV